MNQLFAPYVAIKYQEIQLGYIDGINLLLAKHSLNPDVRLDAGLLKLTRLKKQYEEQLEIAASDPARVKDLLICFRCFDKPDGECHNCD